MVECAVHLSLRRFRRRGEFFCAPLETIAAAIRHALSHLEPSPKPWDNPPLLTPVPHRRCRRSSTLSSVPPRSRKSIATADTVSFSSRYGTIDLDLPPVPRRLRADRARRVRDYIQRSMAERLFREISPVLEPDVVLRPDEAGTYILTINAEPAFRIAIGEKTRWWSRRRTVLATAQTVPGFCEDRLLPSEIPRTGPAGEREAVLHAVTEAALRAFVQHAIAELENSPAFPATPVMCS